MGLIRRAVEFVESRLPADSLRARFAKGIFWSVVGIVIVQSLTLLSSVVTARLLGKVGFGELGIVVSTVGMFGAFAGLGLAITANKHVAELRKDDPERAGRIIGMSSLVAVISGGGMSAVLFVAAPYLAEYTINAPRLTMELRIGCGLLLFNALMGAQTGALSGFEAFKTIAKANLVRGLLSFPVIIAGVYFFGLRGAVTGQVAAVFFGWVINHVALRMEARKAGVPVSYRGIRSELPILYSFSLPATLGGAVVGPALWASRAFLVNEPGGYADMGIFNAAIRFQLLLTLIGSSIGAPLLPLLASREGSSSTVLNRVNILSSWSIALFPALVLICFPEIIGLVFGADFSGQAEQRTLILVMAFTCVLMYKDGLGRLLATNNLMWWGFFSNLLWAVLLVAGSVYLVRFGAVGLAASFALAYVLNTIIIVPLYVYKGLAPKEAIVSRETALIWLALAGIAVAAWSGWQFYLRLALFPLALGVVLYALLRILRGVGVMAMARETGGEDLQ